MTTESIADKPYELLSERDMQAITHANGYTPEEIRQMASARWAALSQLERGFIQGHLYHNAIFHGTKGAPYNLEYFPLGMRGTFAKCVLVNSYRLDWETALAKLLNNPRTERALSLWAEILERHQNVPDLLTGDIKPGEYLKAHINRVSLLWDAIGDPNIPHFVNRYAIQWVSRFGVGGAQ